MKISRIIKELKWGAIRTNADKIVERQYECSGVHPGMGRSYIYIQCPFCKEQIKTFIWSLNGGGKRCDCGALFNSVGTAYHLKEAVADMEVGN